jgi:hypothetical protein
MDRRRVDVKQAAQILNVTTDAVHKRVKRGTLDSVKDEEGRVYVYLDDVQTPDLRDDLIDRLESEIDYLRDESRRKDTILLTMAQRVPELEAASEPRESVATASDGESKGEEVPQDPQNSHKPSWWRRIFK